MGRAKKEVMHKAKGGLWIQKAIQKPGALHRALHVPQDKKIPSGVLSKAAHAQNPLLRHRGQLAQTLKKLSRHRGTR